MSTERRQVAVLSLLFTYLFFLEYLPPLSRVHLPFDIESFHFPLLDYAFQSLSRGAFPEWDAAIYCGISFVGNVQAALFYPPNWLLFAANLGRERLVYKSVEMLAMAHIWLAFCLCFIWLRGRRLGTLAAALGSGVFAYSGYMLSQIQHLGVVTGYAWIPLGLRGIDQAAEQRTWRPLWKLAAASALSLLAGYPPAWFVFCVCAVVYAASGRRGLKTAASAALALLASLPLAMIQLLPALEAAVLKPPEARYGGSLGSALYLSHFLPNYFDPGRREPGGSDPTAEYFYLGAAALFGLLWAARRGFRGQLPALAIAGVSLVMAANPFNLLAPFIQSVPVLREICRDWNFLGGLTLAAALLTAESVNDFLRRSPARRLGPPPGAVAALLAIWSGRQLWVWLPGGAAFPSGWRAAFEPAVTLILLSLALHHLRAGPDRRRTVLAIALLAAAGIEFKVFGTNKLFSAHRGGSGEFQEAARAEDFDELAGQLRAHPEFRVAVDENAIFATDLRHIGLTTPQGFDPFVPEQYKRAIEKYVPFSTDRKFEIDPANETLLRLLGVRWFWTARHSPVYETLATNPNFRQLAPASGYFRVFEFLGARPSWRWDGEAARVHWTAARREVLLRSAAGGRFVLIEQFFPGWRASIDGSPVPIERWNDAFQSVTVPPGEHRVRFEFRSRGLRLGAGITAASLLALVVIARKR